LAIVVAISSPLACLLGALTTLTATPAPLPAYLQVAVQSPPELGDRQESFWLAETLKYLVLLFR
jgi:hypothetical protein